jgi:hypothetical protein
MKILYRYFYNKLTIPDVETDAHLHLLNPTERKAIERLEWIAWVTSGLIGTLAVLLLYLPQYYLPNLFPSMDINLPIVGVTSVPLVATIYGVVLVFIEIWALTILHVYCIQRMAVSMGYITHDSAFLTEKQDKILAVSTEEKDKTLKSFGIDPYQGMKISQVWMVNLFIALKATLSNMVVKILVRRVLGRYAVREVLDLLGIPIFAFWNIMATRNILREARVMIMGQNLIDFIVPTFEKIASEIKDLPETKSLIYDTLQFIAVSKRDYHANHAYLTAKILPIFGIKIEEKHLIPNDYDLRLAAAEPTLKRFCQLLIIIGLLLDGQISWRERKRIQEFHQKNIIDLSVSQLLSLKDDFLEGRGITQWIEPFIDGKL